MNDLTTINVITLLPSGKEQIKSFVSDFKARIVSGERNAIEMLTQLKYAEKTLSELLTDEELDAYFLDEAEKYHKDELLNLNGCKLQVREVGTRYDYSVTNDTVLEDLERQKKQLDAQIKERQKMLQTLSGEIYNEDGVQLQRPVKSSKTKLTVTIQ